MIRRVGFWLTTIGLSAASLVFLWGTQLPLGIPDEWIWDRIPVSDRNDVLLGWTQAAVGAFVYLVYVWIACRRLDHCSRLETACWLSGLILVAFSWLCVLQESPPVDYRTSKVAWVLYFPGSSGYFQHARQMSDVESFLGGYQQLMAEGDVLHIGTHPPGLFLFHRGLIDLCDRSPGLTDLLLQCQPESLKDGFSAIAATSRTVDLALSSAEQAAIWLAALITQFAVVLAIVPLYLLQRRDYSRIASWMTVVFWPVIPAVAVFLPKSDALYPLLAVGFLYFWLEGCTRSSAWRSALAGVLFWMGMLFSLALLPIAVLALLLVIWQLSPLGRQKESFGSARKRCLVALAWAASPFVVLTACVWLGYELNLPDVWRQNYQNHAGFYQQYPRTYWKWLFVNPVELALAAGVPIVVLVVASLLRIHSPATSPYARAAAFYCTLSAWGLLWISGKNMGEAARLWIVLLPFLVWLTAPTWELVACDKEIESRKIAIRNRWLCLLLLQFVVCIATVTRIDGFHLNRYL